MLANGEQLFIDHTSMKLLFETGPLTDATPASITNCVGYLSPSSLLPSPLLPSPLLPSPFFPPPFSLLPSSLLPSPLPSPLLPSLLPSSLLPPPLLPSSLLPSPSPLCIMWLSVGHSVFWCCGTWMEACCLCMACQENRSCSPGEAHFEGVYQWIEWL